MKAIKFIAALLLLSQASFAQVKINLYAVNKGEKFGYVDVTGKLVIDYQYDYVHDFTASGLAVVQKNNLYGVIDQSNKTIIPFEFDEIKLNNTKEYFITRRPGEKLLRELYENTGERIDVPFAGFDETYSFNQSEIINYHVVISVNGKYGLFSLVKEKVVLPAEYGQIKLFKEGVVASKGSTYYFIDYNGKTLFQTDKYNLYQPQISEGLIHVVANRKSGLINLKGELVTPCEYSSIYPFSEKRAVFTDASYKQGYIDENGKVVINAQFFKASEFQKGRASVQMERNGSYGLIDNTGKWIVQPKYYEPVIFTSDRGLAFVKNAKGNIEVELIDLNGKVIKKMPEVEWDYQHTGFDENGICSVHLTLPTGKICRALMDKTGKIIWKGDPFDYCFPKDALVTMADGNTRPIQDIKIGDMVLSMNPETGMITDSKVRAIQKHAGTFEIINMNVASSSQMLTDAGVNKPSDGLQLKCTPNHPVLTTFGKREAGDVTAGQQVYLLNSREIIPGIVSVNYAAEVVNEVWNLVTDSGNYIVNGVVVLVK